MMARARLIGDVAAVSAAGTAHPIRVETTDTYAVVVTVMGPNGKRHASSKLAIAGDVEALIATLRAALDVVNGADA